MEDSVLFGLIIVLLITLRSVLSANHGPIFNDEGATVRVIAGQTAILPCNAKHRGAHTSKIIWMNPVKIVFSNGEHMVIDDNRVLVERNEHGDWNLRIEHVRFNDSGQYQCVINTKPVKVKNVYLRVQVPPHILIEESSRNMDVEEGDTVDLRCKATGVPTPNITWHKRTQSTMDVQENLHIYGEVLTLNKIKKYQKGTYICQADNGVPPAKTRAMDIKVQYAPVVKLTNTRQGQMFGKRTVLECTVTSYPRAKITWKKNGIPIKHGYKHRLEVYPGDKDEFTLSMEIQHINKNDYGDYTCEAQNRMGRDSARMILYEYRELTPPAPTTTPYPHTTSEYTYYYDGEDYIDGDLYNPAYPASGRGYETKRYHKGNRNSKNTYGGNKPYYQTTASKGHKSDLPTTVIITITVAISYMLTTSL